MKAIETVANSIGSVLFLIISPSALWRKYLETKPSIDHLIVQKSLASTVYRTPQSVVFRPPGLNFNSKREFWMAAHVTGYS